MRATGMLVVLAAQSSSVVLGGHPREQVGIFLRALHARERFPGIIHPEEHRDAGANDDQQVQLGELAVRKAAARIESATEEADRAQRDFVLPAVKQHGSREAVDRSSHSVGRLETQPGSLRDRPLESQSSSQRQRLQDGGPQALDAAMVSQPETKAAHVPRNAGKSGMLHPQDAARRFARLLGEHHTQEEAPQQPAQPQLPDAIKKPMMSGINVMRTEMCWKRPNLMQHEKCMKFLGLHCATGSTGKGICKAFRKKVAEACRNKTGKTPELQEQQCKLDEDLNEKEVKDPNADDDNDGHSNSEDLFPDDPNEVDDADMDGVGDNSDDDKDGDGIRNDEDHFPMDPKEWVDTDGDGIGDNVDDDNDGDGVSNADDPFPQDKNEWKDLDGDGIGDNSDEDRDGDGHNNDKDPFPDDPTRYTGSENEGLGLPGMPQNLDQPLPGDEEEVIEDDTVEGQVVGGQVVEGGSVDSDGDGVVDEEDAFPNDPSESADTDGDGVGDVADVFPEDASEQMDSDGDGVGDNADHFPDDPNESIDSDGDGVGDMLDAFPDDANEWTDSDGDSIGDNADLYPNNPDCHKDPCGSPDVVVAASPAGAGAGAPAGSPAAPGAVPAMILPWELNKVGRGLPPQGYNEHSKGHDDLVDHDDMETWTGDWGKEWPHKRESEQESIGKICSRHPNSIWCKKYEEHGHFAR